MTPPLDGTLVVDASRMLPGAVLARQLLDLGARLIKVEEPAGGDPLRGAPPLADGSGAGFAEFFRGAESIALDLRDAGDAARLRKLARGADVLIESFRPGSLEAWDLAPRRLLEINPALVVCRLTGFGTEGKAAGRVGHDLNLVATSGLLRLLGPSGLPRVQIADVNAGLLAATAVLAALLARGRTGRGCVIDQPLASGPMPLLAWPLADAAAGGGGLTEPGRLLTGGCAAYRVYACADGRELAVAAIEPKFWSALIEMLDLAGLEGAGLDDGAEGREAMRALERRFAEAPRERWLDEAARRGLPLSPVHDLGEAAREPALAEARLLAGGRCAAFLPAVGRRPAAPAPALDEHGPRLAREFGLTDG